MAIAPPGGSDHPALRPRDHLPRHGQLPLHVGPYRGVVVPVVVQDPQGVLSHHFAGEKFRCCLREVQAQLYSASFDVDAQFVVREKQSAIRVRGGSAGIEEPGRRSGRIDVEQLQQFLLEVPELPELLLRDIQRPQLNDCAKKGEIWRRIARARKDRKIKAGLESGDLHVAPVQSLGDLGEGSHGKTVWMRVVSRSRFGTFGSVQNSRDDFLGGLRYHGVREPHS